MRLRRGPIVVTVGVLAAGCGGPSSSSAHDAEFRSATAGVDRLDVSSNPYLDPYDTPPAFSVLASDDVRRFLDLVRFEDRPAEAPCACRGFVDFDLRHGDALVLHLSLHAHWTLEGVPWGHQAPLTKESSGQVCNWLASCGAPAALALWNDGVRRDAADANRTARQTAILGDDVCRRVRDAKVPADTFAAAFPEAERRAAVALRICAGEFGARPRDIVSDAAIASLDALPPSIVTAAMDAAGADAETARGAAFWLVAHSGWDRTAPADLDRLIRPAIDRLLEDSNPDVRRAAITGLHRLDHPAAVAALRRSLRDEDATVSFLAARDLIERGDRKLVPEIRAAAGRMKPRDRAEITRLLQWL